MLTSSFLDLRTEIILTLSPRFVVKDFRFVIKLNPTGIPFVLHHGRIPPSSRKRRVTFLPYTRRIYSHTLWMVVGL